MSYHTHIVSLPPHSGHRAEVAIIAWTNPTTLATYASHNGPIRQLILPVRGDQPRSIAYIIVPDELHPLHNLQENVGVFAMVGPFGPVFGKEHNNIRNLIDRGIDLPSNSSLIGCEIISPEGNILNIIHGLRTCAATAASDYRASITSVQSAFAKATSPF